MKRIEEIREKEKEVLGRLNIIETASVTIIVIFVVFTIGCLVMLSEIIENTEKNIIENETRDFFVECKNICDNGINPFSEGEVSCIDLCLKTRQKENINIDKTLERSNKE